MKVMRSKVLLVSLLLPAVFLTASCGTNTPAVKPATETTASDPVMQYLGDYCYSNNEAALVYEKIEGETDDDGNPLMGIQYREINDLEGLLHQTQKPVLLYFYSAQASDTSGMTALAEDLAQTLSGRLLTVSVDALSHQDLAGEYEIVSLPEFILIEDGKNKDTFKSSEYGYWDAEDVVEWITSCGYPPDTSKLE